MTTVDPTPHIDITIKASNRIELIESSQLVARKCRIDFAEQSNLVHKIFTDGLSNQLIGWRLAEKPDDMVLVRIYGESTSKLVDRVQELATIKLLAENNIGSKLFATFNNGFVYEYLPGTVLNCIDLDHQDIWPLIAKAVSKMHQIKHNWSMKPSIFDQIRKIINTTDSNNNQSSIGSNSKIPTTDELIRELEYLEHNLPKPDLADLVFSHNDLLPRNIIKQSDRCLFIDFEYAGINHRAMDIGNHFCEFADIGTKYDPSKCPNDSFKLDWIKVYLAELGFIGNDLEQRTRSLLDEVSFRQF